jgi:hypothetical protein
MKRIYSRIPYILSILSLTVNCQLLTVNSLQAQVQSAAFDPNCYQPVIGTPGVVDTIYGSRNFQELGVRVKNLWQIPGESYGNIVISENDPLNSLKLLYPIYQSGPFFDLHHLQAIDTFKLPFGNTIDPNYIVKRAHYRSKKYVDILINDPEAVHIPPRIYWADEKGGYDSLRFTDLLSPVAGKYGPQYNRINIYTAFLSSDSVYDIVFGITKLNYGGTNDSVYLLYFQGGEQLFAKGDTAYADSAALLDTLGVSYRYFSQGDYRGTGREDLIASSMYAGNVFFYKNDTPFSLSKLADAMKYDTLMAFWQNPNGGSVFDVNQLSMRAFKKSTGDNSVDLVLSTYSLNGKVPIYKGGPDFGSTRLFETKPDFTIHHPATYDFQWNGLADFGSGLHNCGDMTGTGNNILCVTGQEDASFYEYYFFYVLGEAIDDKVDMYFSMDYNSQPYGIDTLTADKDNLQDIIVGIPLYNSQEDFDNSKQTVGTVWIIHGSKNIPVTVNGVPALPQNDADIRIYPNPVTNNNCTVDFGNTNPQEIELSIFDLLGRKVYSEHIYMPFFRKSFPVSIPFASGSYSAEITGKSFTKRIQLTVLK